MASDECGFLHDRVLVPRTLKSLIPELNFAPILASSLIYLRKFRRTRSLNLLGNVVLPFVLPAIAIILSALLLNGDPTTWARLAFPIEIVLAASYVAAVFAGIARFSRRDRRLRLKADSEANMIVGRGALLHALEGLDLLRLDDLERRKSQGTLSKLYL
jgi:hypothetical protein